MPSDLRIRANPLAALTFMPISSRVSLCPCAPTLADRWRTRQSTPPSAGDPAVPAVGGGGALVEVGHLDAGEVVLRDLVALGVDVDSEQARGVEAEDLLLHRARERSVAVRGYQRRRDLEAAERVDLPLRRAVPDRVRAPEHMVGAERGHDLAEQVGARRGVGGDE